MSNEQSAPTFQGMTVKGFTPPLKLSDFKLIAFDMDSTLINIECIDEIADAAGRKAEVAAITEAAMRGEIADYKDSLRRRVALLKGVTVAHMEEVLNHRLQLNPGAENLVKACQAASMKVLLVSGGFTFFTDHVKDRLNINWTRSNVLEVVNGELTGRMVDQDWGDICDGEEKRKMLLQTCQQMGITASQAIAMGDGANDLPMMGVAGLSVAYHAKPKVREQAMVAIEDGGLDRLLEVFN
ncbi:MAG: phosphoserine phosphatase SerB [Limnohabitans sp.]|jgi:phosphoserine phosphatase